MKTGAGGKWQSRSSMVQTLIFEKRKKLKNFKKRKIAFILVLSVYFCQDDTLYYLVY